MKTVTIKQGAMMPGSPHDVYELLMDEKQHEEFTGDTAQISRSVNGSFTTFGGWATGKNIELVKDKKIIQTWRGSDWPEGSESTITIKLLPAKSDTKLMFSQTGVPSGLAADVEKGWREYYWAPMKKLLGSRRKA